MCQTIISILFTCFVGISLSISVPSSAQDLTAYHDNRQDFYVFDKGSFRQIEYLPVKEFKFDNPYLAYISNDSKFKVYDDGVKLLHKRLPTWYSVNDSFLVYRFYNSLYVYKDGKRRVVAKLIVEPVAYNNHALAYNDNMDFFKVFDFDTTRTLEQTPVQETRGKANMLVYFDPYEDFKVYTKGELFTIETSAEPREYKIARNIVAYRDYNDIFKVFYKGEVQELESFTPKSFHPGQNMVAYVDNTDRFKVFYKGELRQLLSYRPAKMGVEKNILYYTDRNDYLYVFYKGEEVRLETYSPESLQADHNMLVYKDLDGGLKAFINGRQKTITDQSVQSFSLNGSTVQFVPVKNHLRIYWNNKVYKAY